MTSAPLIYFGTEDTRPPVKIVTTRPMLLRVHGKDGLEHVPAGGTVTITANDVDRLEAGDFRRVVGDVETA